MGLTFGDLFALYYERHAKTRTRCPQNAYYFFKAHGSRWQDVPVDQITPAAVQDWVDEYGVKSKSAATRAVNVMAAVLNWGIKRGYVTCLNPCITVERFRVNPRDRFLLPDELERFKKALDRQPQQYCDFFYLCLLTGARRGNVLAMRWDELDLTLGIWVFSTKNGDRLTLPLCTTAKAILLRRQQAHEKDNPWVFPGRRPNTHVVEPKRAWAKLLREANLSDLRIHDLRRTLGSYLAITGNSQYVIGKALGHRDQRSTAVYARLNLDPIRKAIEDVSDQWLT